MPLISKPGAYLDIANEDYHRNIGLLPAPSLSSSGAKTLINNSPRHFWFDSPLNPNRPEEDNKPHFAIGKAAHDMILLADRWPDFYHVLPEGFSRAATKKFGDAIAEADAAQESGLTILRHDDAETVRQVVAAIKANEFAMMALTNGVTEETIAWQDEATGVWLRARPDFRPNSIPAKRKVRVLADLKFVAPMVAVSAYVRSRRNLRAAEQRLNALRSNCSIRNERGQMLRYVNASPEVRARAETN